MCSMVRCGGCGKATWSGCGLHVEQALAGVPESERCRCHAPGAAADRGAAGGARRDANDPRHPGR